MTLGEIKELYSGRDDDSKEVFYGPDLKPVEFGVSTKDILVFTTEEDRDTTHRALEKKIKELTYV